MERLAALNRDSARMAAQIFCRYCGCSSWFEAMTDECCLTAKGLECDFTGERGGQGAVSPRILLNTSSPETETTQARGTSKAKGAAKHGKPGTDTDHVPSTAFLLVDDDQETRGAIDDPEAVAAFARSFQLS